MFPSFLQASWIAMISPWQVGSLFFDDLIMALADHLPIFDDDGPERDRPSPDSMPFSASSMAKAT
jgi:hypothetical protein